MKTDEAVLSSARENIVILKSLAQEYVLDMAAAERLKMQERVDALDEELNLVLDDLEIEEEIVAQLEQSSK